MCHPFPADESRLYLDDLQSSEASLIQMILDRSLMNRSQAHWDAYRPMQSLVPPCVGSVSWPKSLADATREHGTKIVPFPPSRQVSCILKVS